MAKKRKADDFDSWLSSQDTDRQQTVSSRPEAEDFSTWYQNQQERPVETRYITATPAGLRQLAEDKARRRSPAGNSAFESAVRRAGYQYNENNWSQQRSDGGTNPKTRKYYLYNENNWNQMVPDGGEKRKQKTYYPYNQNNWNQQLSDTGSSKRNQQQSAGGDAPFALAPSEDVYEQRRAGLGQYIQANRTAAGDRVIKSFSDYGWNDEALVPAEQMTKDEKPKFIQNFEAMSSAEIKERQDLYKQNVSQDLTIAKNLLQGTFAGVQPGYSRERENIGLKYGIDANDPEALRQLVDRLERGVLYTDQNGKETTFDGLYNAALNREREEQTVLPPAEQAYIQSLYSMSSQELEQKYRQQDETNRNEDLNIAENLLNYAVPWFEYDDQSDVGQARAHLRDTYGIDPTDENALRALISDLHNYKTSDVIYTDSNGRNYTYQDLYYNAENREQFGRMESDTGSLELLSEGLRLQKQIDMYNAYIVDSGTAAEYMPMITDLKHKQDLLSSRLSENGYDMDRMLGYLNTEEAKQRFIMQSQATAAWTEKNPVLANIASMLSTPLQAVEWMANDTGSGNPEDLQNYVPKNYYGMDATNFSSAVRSTTSRMIQNEMLGAGFSDTFANLAAETYSGVLSAAQSRILALTCTALAGPVWGEAISLAIMGSSAASETLKEGINRGLDDRHAITNAVFAGMNEVLFEKVSLDRFMDTVMDKGNLGNTLLSMLKGSQLQRLVEGSEEFFTDIANNIADALINGDMSKYRTNIRAYMNNGLSYDDAVNKANQEYLTEYAQSAFGGYIGGGGMGAYALNSIVNSTPFQAAMAPIGNAINNYEQNRAYQNVGAGVVNNQNVGSLIETAQQSGDVTLQNLANEVAAQEAGMVQKPSRKQQKQFETKVGQLASETVRTNVQKATGSQISTVRATIKSELDARNIKPTDKVIDVVEKVYNNEDLNADERSIAASVKASDIAGSLQERSSEIEAEASRTSTEALKRVTKVREMVADLGDKVSNSGQVVNRNTGKAVEIDEVASVEKNDDGEYTMTLKLADGSRVNSADLQYANSTQATLYEAVRATGMNAEVGNAIIRAYDGKGTSNAFSYVQGMVEGLNYGRTNQTAEMASKDTFFSDLTEPQKNLALQLGQMENQTAISEAAARISSLRNITKNPRRVGSIDVRSDMAGLNNAQRTGIRTIEMLVDDGVLTNNFHFFSSAEGARGRVLTEDIGGLKKGDSAPNGFYDPKTGDIYIDVNAGNSGEGTVLFTAAHELTHFVKQWSPQKFNDLASFLVNEYHGAGVSVDSLVRNQMRKGSGRNLSYDDAFEEFVADSMQTMFTDGSLASRLEKLRNTDKTLFDKIVDFIKKLQKGINKVYARYTPDSEEAKALSQIKGVVDRLADMFAEGITEATENYNVTDASNLSAKDLAELEKKGFAVTNGLIVAKNMEAIAAQVKKPGSLNIYSYRTEPEWEKSVIAQWGDTEETRRYINAIRAFTNAMVSDDAIRRVVPMGSYAYDKYGPLRDNVEYVITFDMDTSCPRTFQFTKYRDRLQAYANRPLTYNESVNLLELMRAYGQNIPCSYCYVENKRVLLAASYNNFFKFRNDVLNEQDPKKAMAKMYGYDEKKGTLAKASQKVFDTWRSDMSYNPTVQEIWEASQLARNSVFNFLDDANRNGDINIKKSQKAIEELVCDHFGVKGQTPRSEISGFVSEWIYDTFAEKEHTYLQKNDPSVSEVNVRALALNHEALAYAKSASSAKTVSSYVPYTDQLKNISKEVKDYVIGMGGIRKHSSNDFRIDYVQDYLMFYADLAAGGWTGHTYTKSPDFVKIFGNTGDRINMSIAMTDGPNGQVRENALEGMYWSVAQELRKAYKNAGVMSMVTSDAQLSYALNADWVDMIIPFHASSLDKHVWYDLRHWFDYTSKQLERFYNSTEMELALIQKALDDAGVKYSSDQMNADLIAMAKKAGAGGKSDDRAKIINREIKRLKSLASKNGVKFNPKMSTTEIEAAYNSAFNIKAVYNAEGKRIKPHFLPGETVVDGVTIPGHSNNINRYLELCREYGVHPRFDGVAVQDKNGNDINVIDHEGYLKLIKETARTDSEQGKIRFNFDQYDEYLKMTPMEYAMQQLHDNADIGMYDNMSEDPMGIQKKFIDNYLGKDREIGWLTEEARDYMEMREEDQAKLNTGDVDKLPRYEDNQDIRYSQRVTDREMLDFLNKQDYITTYRTMQLIDGGLYSPMNSLEDVDDNGKRKLGFRSELGQWEMATEAPEKTKPKKLKNGKVVWTYDLKDAHGNTDAVAYNPYEHSANYVLNDQFTGAYKRDNIVVVECRVPVSEANGAYRAEKAHNATGWTSWHKGPVAAKIAKATKGTDHPFDRQLFLSRYLMPVRIVPDAEVAKMHGDYLRGTDVAVNWNVVSPGLLEELVKQGVPVTDKPSSASVKEKMPENLRKMMSQNQATDNVTPKFSDRDSDGNALTPTQQEFFKDSKIRDAEGNLLRVYHGTNGQFNVFRQGTAQGWGRGTYFTDNRASASEYGKNIVEGYLNIKNPFDARTMEPMDIAEDIYKTKAFQKYDMGVYKRAYSDDYDSYKDYVADGRRADVLDMYENDVDAFNTALRELGYDGIIAQDSNDIEGLEIVAFKPEQIKLMTNKAPTENPDIRYSDRDSGSHFDEQYETMPDGRIRPRNVADLSTEDWKTIYQVTKKLGYGIKSASEAKQVYGKYVGDNGFNKEQSDALKAAYGVTEQKTTSANPQRVAAAKKEFGVTYDMSEAGYITPDGTMLDFSGKKEGGPGHVRYMDHREISRVFDTSNDENYFDMSKYMNAFISEGNIRLMDEFGVTMGEIEPTTKQYNVLQKFIARTLQKSGSFLLDISNDKGITIADRDYHNGETPSKIISDIKEYYKTGELPYSQYADEYMPYSDRDPDATDTRTLLSNALLDAAQNDMERKYIADYQEKIQAMNEEQNRLNEIRDDIRNMTFGKAPHTKEHLNSLKEEATRLANRINVYDKQLLRIEAMKPMKAVIARETDKVKTRIKAEQAAFMADYKNRVSSREYIARIEHEVKGLRDRLLHPKAKTIIPEAFAKPAADFLASIDFSTFNPDGTRRSGKANTTRAELQSKLDALANSIDTASLEAEYGQMDISPDMLTWIDNTKTYLEDNFSADDTYVLRKMSPEQLKDLYKMVVALRTAVNQAGRMYTNMSSNVADLGANTIDYLAPYIGRERRAIGAKVYKTLGWDYAQPVTAFERFGPAGKKVFNGLMQGQKREAENVQKIRDFVETAYSREEVNTWQEEMHDVSIGGRTYNVPTSYIQELYCMMKDEDARRHIVEGGGIRFSDLTYGRVGNRKTRIFENTMITEDEVNAMINMLTPRQKEVADHLQEFMDVIGADWGNEISMKRFGYHAFGQVQNYYPIKTIKQNSEYEARQKRANIYALLNKSFTKERVTNANNAVIIGDIFKTFADHMSEMAVYNSWALPVIDTIKWYNYREAQNLATDTPERSVKDALRQAFGYENGNPADEYIRRLLESINSQRSGGLSESIAFHSLRMVNRVAVAGNIRVAVQQPFSITRAMTLISPKYFRPMSVSTMKREYAEMVEQSSFGRWKGMGYYDVDIARPLQTQVMKNESFADKVTDKTMVLAEKGDQWTWTTLWHACKLEAQARGLTGDDLMKAAGEKFDDVITHTQVVDSVLTKSQWMRSDSFWHRMTSAFMSEPMTSYNTLLRQFDKFNRDIVEYGLAEAKKRNHKAFWRTVSVFVLTELVNAIVTAPIDAARDDDDYKTYLEKMLEKFAKHALENLIPTNMMPFLADITDYIMYGSTDRADLSIYTKAIDLGKQIYTAIKSDEELSIYKRNKFIMAGLTAISQVTGLPISNVARDVLSIWNAVVSDIDYGAKKFQTAKDENKVGYQQFLKALHRDNDDRRDYLYMQMQSNGITTDTIYSGVIDLIHDEYNDGDPEGDVTENIIKLRGYFKEEDPDIAESYAGFLTSWWDYMGSRTDRVLNASAYEAYYYNAMPSGIDVETYEDYYTRKEGLSKQAEIVPIIDSLPITAEQKDALYLMKWKPANLGNTPWHQ